MSPSNRCWRRWLASDAIQTVHDAGSCDHVGGPSIATSPWRPAAGSSCWVRKSAAQDDLASYQRCGGLSWSALTPRERDILTLDHERPGHGTTSRRFWKISKGTIKNCKIRIYRKVDVTSERDLIKKFSPFFPSA